MVAFAGHPLVVDERVVGVMALFARHALSDAVIAALASVADHIALGIERHRSAEALRSAEERMRFALQNADVGIWDMDYTTGVLRWSETMRGPLRPGARNVRRDVRGVRRAHSSRRPRVPDRDRREGHEVRHGLQVEHRSIWPDGTVRWLSGAGRVHLASTASPCAASVFPWTSPPWRKLELELRHAQKLESVGRLASGVANE